MFKSSLLHTLITCGKKEFLKYSVVQRNKYGNSWGVFENFSLVEVSCECVMVTQLKEIYIINTITSSNLS